MTGLDVEVYQCRTCGDPMTVETARYGLRCDCGSKVFRKVEPPTVRFRRAR